MRRGRVRLETPRVARKIIVIAVTLGVWLPPVNLAAQSPNAALGPSFEAASIKVNRSGDLRANFQPLPGGRLTATNIPLRAIIRYAYRVENFQIDGGPSWVVSDRF